MHIGLWLVITHPCCFWLGDAFESNFPESELNKERKISKVKNVFHVRILLCGKPNESGCGPFVGWCGWRVGVPEPSDCSPDFKQSSLELYWLYASKQDFATQIKQLEVPRNQGFCSKNMVTIHVSWVIPVSWTNGDHWPKHQMTWERD